MAAGPAAPQAGNASSVTPESSRVPGSPPSRQPRHDPGPRGGPAPRPGSTAPLRLALPLIALAAVIGGAIALVRRGGAAARRKLAATFRTFPLGLFRRALDVLRDRRLGQRAGAILLGGQAPDGPIGAFAVGAYRKLIAAAVGGFLAFLRSAFRVDSARLLRRRVRARPHRGDHRLARMAPPERPAGRTGAPVTGTGVLVTWEFALILVSIIAAGGTLIWRIHCAHPRPSAPSSRCIASKWRATTPRSPPSAASRNASPPPSTS